ITKMEDWLTRALDHATEKGMEKGMERGIEKGMDRGVAKKLVLCVDSLMKNEGYSKERTCRVLDSTVDEYETAKRLLTRETVIV
ncbi:MAG: hypothetical protein LUF30_06665, partial [Lachnospiraceae bacterium]|nr:hypothetical protein [Lachnospiraceae bacterium]